MNYCNEILLDDIVRVDFYDASSTSQMISRSLPFSIPGVSSMTVMQGNVNLATSYGTPILSLAHTGNDISALMATPSHKTTEERNPEMLVRTHALTIPIEMGFDAVLQADDALSGKEILVVLTAYDGSKLCVHYLPASTILKFEENRGDEHTGTLHYEAKSLSGLVNLIVPIQENSISD